MLTIPNNLANDLLRHLPQLLLLIPKDSINSSTVTRNALRITLRNLNKLQTIKQRQSQ